MLGEQLREAGLATPVIVLTTFDDHEQVLEGIRAGAKGYLLKDVSLENLIRAIESVAAGETMIQPAVTAPESFSTSRAISSNPRAWKK